MNLADMVVQVCADTGYVDADDQLFARTALRQRDDLLWRMGMWKDSLVQVNVPVDPSSNRDHAEGVIYLPEVIERVVAVRTADQSLRVSGLETFYRANFDQFNATGSPVQFAKLSPGWFTWRGYLGLQVYAVAPDTTVKSKIVWHDGTGRRYTQQLLSGQFLDSTPLTDADEMSTVVLVSGAGTVAVDGVYVGSGTTFVQVTDARYAILSDGVGGMAIVFYAVPNVPTVVYTANHTSDAGTATWTAGVGYGAVPAPTSSWPLESRIEVVSMFKPTTTGGISLLPQINGDATGGTLLLGDTKSPTYQRIRIFPIPTADGAIAVLGKAAYVPLDFDQQEPLITGSHLALMAFAKHLLLKRGGENGTAVDAIQEATALLDTLKKEELLQEANNQRIIPDSGYGDAFFGPGRDGFWVG